MASDFKNVSHYAGYKCGEICLHNQKKEGEGCLNDEILHLCYFLAACLPPHNYFVGLFVIEGDLQGDGIRNEDNP